MASGDINQTALDLDALMDRILEDPTIATPQDIDQVIAYQRKYRAQFEAGQKPKKASTGAKLDLNLLGLMPAAETVKRRF